MLIVCPNCQTYYTVDRRGFEPNGRTVRCHNCGNSWRQGLVPENSVPPAMQQASAQTAPTPQPYPPQAYAPYPTQQPATVAPEPAPAPAPAPVPAPPSTMPMDDDDVVEPDFDLPDPDEEDNLEDDIAANIDELFGEDDDENLAAPEPEDDLGIHDNENEDDDLTDEDIDSLFDDDEETGISSMFESGGSDEDDISDLDEIPEPDPLPESLTGGLEDEDDEDDAPIGRLPRRKQPKKNGKGGLIAFIVILLLLLGLGAGGFFFRTLIAETVPESKIIYDMIGIDTGVLGDGLEIQNVQSARATEAGIDMLIVSGRIANVIDKPAPVPLIQAILLDADGMELQTVMQEPSQTELSPGNQIEFSIRIDEPSPLSRRMEVTFAPRGDGN